MSKKPNKLIELVKNVFHIYSPKTYKDGSTVFCDYIKKEYYENGKLDSESPFANGKIHGIVKDYYENGQLKEESVYDNSELKGTIIMTKMVTLL